jgi:hypothetical protein
MCTCSRLCTDSIEKGLLYYYQQTNMRRRNDPCSGLNGNPLVDACGLALSPVETYESNGPMDLTGWLIRDAASTPPFKQALLIG